MNSKTRFYSIIFFGISLRLVFMPFCYHPDFIFINTLPFKFASEFMINPNVFFSQVFGHVISVGGSYYSAFTYYFLGAFQAVFRIIYPVMDIFMEHIMLLLSKLI